MYKRAVWVLLCCLLCLPANPAAARAPFMDFQDIPLSNENAAVELRTFPGMRIIRDGNKAFLLRGSAKTLLGAFDPGDFPEVPLADIDGDGKPEFFICVANGVISAGFSLVDMSGKDIGKYLFPAWVGELFPPPSFDAASRAVRFHMCSGVLADTETWGYSKAKKHFYLRERTEPANGTGDPLLLEFRHRWDERGKELPRNLRMYGDLENRPVRCLVPAVRSVHARPGDAAPAFTLPQ